ncbi:MAG: hypothetical protein IT257_07510, partial [Chitinophagaceae bacterium]|nr:hypothetical protein [Chitinophagaceae bacterium]
MKKIVILALALFVSGTMFADKKCCKDKKSCKKECSKPATATTNSDGTATVTPTTT